jgi:hypothetical protein
LLFVKDDPKASKVWVCDPESRLETRDAARSIVMVSRGDYLPQELHLLNAGDGASDQRDYSDLATVPVIIQCEAGSKIASDVLASVVYHVLKLFRLDLMRDYDIHSLKFSSIGPPVKYDDQPGKPWITTVSLRIETQEHSRYREIATHLNKAQIAVTFAENTQKRLLSLDSTPQ